MSQDVIITGGEEFGALARRLKAAQPLLRKELTKKLNAAAKPAMEDLRAAILALPSGGSRGGGGQARAVHAAGRVKTAAGKARAMGRSHGLRATMAKAVSLRQTTSVSGSGVRIRVNTDAMPPGQRSLPRALDGGKGWRHPVFGNMSTWVTQTSHPYFYTTLRKHEVPARDAILAAMREVGSKIE